MGLKSTTHRELLKLDNKNTKQPSSKDWAKDFHRHFSKLQAHPALLCFTGAVLSNKLKARPSASKKTITTRFTVMLAFIAVSGAKPAISLRSASTQRLSGT